MILQRTKAGVWQVAYNGYVKLTHCSEVASAIVIGLTMKQNEEANKALLKLTTKSHV